MISTGQQAFMKTNLSLKQIASCQESAFLGIAKSLLANALAGWCLNNPCDSAFDPIVSDVIAARLKPAMRPWWMRISGVCALTAVNSINRPAWHWCDRPLRKGQVA